jgi:hypothetical protein
MMAEYSFVSTREIVVAMPSHPHARRIRSKYEP